MRSPVIPFYGVEKTELFSIERQAMDRSGKVIAAIDRLLPRDGPVLDLGAGDGFTALQLRTESRPIIGLEPAMRPQPRAGRQWIRGAAPELPLRNGAVAGAYSTWAYFFPEVQDISRGLDELDRVVADDGPVIVVDNAGDDAFCSMTDQAIATPLEVWRELGFDVEVVETAFEFEDLQQARRLLQFFFGDGVRIARTIEFRVAVAVRAAQSVQKQ